MNGTQWRPSVVVGIDFGMTCTGVAYSCEDASWARPQVIQRWPAPGLFNKYPTQVAYNNANELVDWGKFALSPNVSRREREFKLYLNPLFTDPADSMVSHQSAVKSYIDYMSELNRHINQTFTQIFRFPAWSQRQVEYRFSLPTTWTDARLTEKLRQWLAAAGFANSSMCRITFPRTEAEAAAVYAADSCQQGDIIMIVDAGGATTDLNILQVTEKGPEITRMQTLDRAEGINLGSVLIDVAAREKVEQKLEALQLPLNTNLKWLAEELMDVNHFERFKCRFGSEGSRVDHYMEIPNLPGPMVVFTVSELKEIFDLQIDRLIVTMREKIWALISTNPQYQLQYIVLSGGLGSSKYVQRRLETDLNIPASGSGRLQILQAAEPQLAVVKGLVMDRSQTLQYDVSAWDGDRCCRVSYGVICTVPYDSKLHANERTVKDKFTGDLWVTDQIDWIIKKDERVPQAGVRKGYSLRITEDKRLEPFVAHIVMSEDPPNYLPTSARKGSKVTKMCTVHGSFSMADFTTDDFFKKSHVLSKKKDHMKAQFYLRVHVGPTDLEFGFESVNGQQRYTQDSAKVEVIWSEFSPPTTHVNSNGRF